MMSIGKPMKRSCSARNGDAPRANPNKTKHNKKNLAYPRFQFVHLGFDDHVTTLSLKRRRMS